MHRRPATTESPATDRGRRRRGRDTTGTATNPAPAGPTPADTLGDRTAEPDVKLPTIAA